MVVGKAGNAMCAAIMVGEKQIIVKDGNALPYLGICAKLGFRHHCHWPNGLQAKDGL